MKTLSPKPTMRSRLTTLLLLALTVSLASAYNQAEVRDASGNLIANGATAAGTLAGFSSTEFELRFTHVAAPYIAPPIYFDGENHRNSRGWARTSARSSLEVAYINQVARVIGVDDWRDWSLVMPQELPLTRGISNEFPTYEAGMRLPFVLHYHPEPTSTQAETATVRLYINGGTNGHITTDMGIPQYDIQVEAAPPAYDVSEFAAAPLPAGVLGAPHATPIPDMPGEARLALSGIANPEHNGSRVHVRWRRPDADPPTWSEWAPLATVSGGAWAGSIALPRGAEIDVDLILAGANQYRQYLPGIELLDASGPTSDFAEVEADSVERILKLALGIDPDAPYYGQLTPITPVEKSGQMHMAITYNIDPAYADDIRVTPEWSPDHQAQPFRAAGVIREKLGVDVLTGLEQWRATAPQPGTAYMRLTVERKSPNSTTHRGPEDAPFFVVATIENFDVQIDGTGAIPTRLGDVLYDQTTSPTYYEGGRIISDAPVVEALTPAIATLNAEREIIRQSDGVAEFRAVVGNVGSTVTQDVSAQGGQVMGGVYSDIYDGGLAAHMIHEVESRLSPGMDAETNARIFAMHPPAAPYTRNANFWAGDVTHWAALNDRNGQARTLITPRHMIGAAHWQFGVGASMTWIEPDGTPHTRTVIGKKTHPLYTTTTYAQDFTIYTLSADLPATIAPMPVLPTNWQDYLVDPSVSFLDYRAPGWGTDQTGKVLVRDFGAQWGGAIRYKTPADPTRLAMYEPIVLYDSGNPAGSIIDGQAILHTVWTFGGGGAGSPTGGIIETTGISMETYLNQMIVDSDTAAGVSGVANPAWPNAGGHYQVQPFDLTDFPNHTLENYLVENGRREIWVEQAAINGRPSYRMRPRRADHSRLYWTGTQWQVDIYVADVLDSTVATSTDDVATPDLATFTGGYVFETP